MENQRYKRLLARYRQIADFENYLLLDFRSLVFDQFFIDLKVKISLK